MVCRSSAFSFRNRPAEHPRRECCGACGDRRRPTAAASHHERALACLPAERKPVVAVRHVFLSERRLEFSSHLPAVVPALSVSPRRTERAGRDLQWRPIMAGSGRMPAWRTGGGSVDVGERPIRIVSGGGFARQARSWPASSWFAAIYAPNVHCFVLAVSLAAFFNDLTMPSAWAVCQNIGGRYAGIAAACMNTIGTLGQRCRHLVDRHVRRAFAGRQGSCDLGIAADGLPAAEKHAASTRRLRSGSSHLCRRIHAGGRLLVVDRSARTIFPQSAVANQDPLHRTSIEPERHGP